MIAVCRTTGAQADCGRTGTRQLAPTDPAVVVSVAVSGTFFRSRRNADFGGILSVSAFRTARPSYSHIPRSTPFSGRGSKSPECMMEACGLTCRDLSFRPLRSSNTMNLRRSANLFVMTALLSCGSPADAGGLWFHHGIGACGGCCESRCSHCSRAWNSGCACGHAVASCCGGGGAAWGMMSLSHRTTFLSGYEGLPNMDGGGVHYRYPYHSYRRPWFHPGPPSTNITICW